MTMLKILCKLVSKQQSNSMLKKVKSLMRNASSYPLSNLWSDSFSFLFLYYNGHASILVDQLFRRNVAESRDA